MPGSLPTKATVASNVEQASPVQESSLWFVCYPLARSPHAAPKLQRTKSSKLRIGCSKCRMQYRKATVNPASLVLVEREPLINTLGQYNDKSTDFGHTGPRSNFSSQAVRRAMRFGERGGLKCAGTKGIFRHHDGQQGIIAGGISLLTRLRI